MVSLRLGPSGQGYNRGDTRMAPSNDIIEEIFMENKFAKSFRLVLKNGSKLGCETITMTFKSSRRRDEMLGLIKSSADFLWSLLK